MCGIVGSVQVGTVESYRASVRHAMRLMAHRGPDGEGFREFVVSNRTPNSGGIPTATVLMGHRRLAIIDLTEAALQPMSTPSGRFHLIFNGEIYNYREIRTELESLGHTFRTRSDTEVLLLGWERWGTSLLPRLTGMFSFAILDRDNSHLTLARDPFGIKPLYYAQNGESLVFASELAPLLDFPGVSRRADPETLFEFLSGGMGDHSNKTFFGDIHQLPAAHFLSVPCLSPGTALPMRYWELQRKPSAAISTKEAGVRFRDLFEESIKFHLRSDVPVGVSLSGGMDSSSITAMVRSVQGQQPPLQTFSYVADDPQLSEERWCALVAHAASAQQNLIRIQPGELTEDFQRLVRVQEQPFGSPTIYAQYRIFQCAHETGMKVILGGQGADQYLGYVQHISVRLASLLRTGRLIDAMRFLRHVRSFPSSGGLSMRAVVRNFLPERLVATTRSLRRVAAPGINVNWFRDRKVGAHSLARSHAGLHDLLKHAVLKTLPSLLRFEDRNAMRFSIENRVPFLTTKLVDFVFSLPEEEIVSADGTRKAILLRAMQGVVPEEILERRDKIGFAMPIANLTHEAESWMKGIFREAGAIPALDAAEVQRQLNLRLFDRASATHLRLAVWRWLSLVTWVREFDVRFE